MVLNIVLPMAGEGSRFVQAGFKKPKPFIDVDGEPMVTKVLKNLFFEGAHFYLIAKSEHLAAESPLVKRISNEFPVTFIPIERKTEGSACTVLYARKYINNNTPLLIANSDQIVDMNIKTFIDDSFTRKLDGSILTFEDKELSPKWSFAKIGPDNLVVSVKEKEAISKFATVGIYLFMKGSYFVASALDMIIQNERVNNEFYTCPVYNYMIREGKKIGIFNIPANSMHGLGTPKDLETYLQAI